MWSIWALSILHFFCSPVLRAANYVWIPMRSPVACSVPVVYNLLTVNLLLGAVCRYDLSFFYVNDWGASQHQTSLSGYARMIFDREGIFRFSQKTGKCPMDLKLGGGIMMRTPRMGERSTNPADWLSRAHPAQHPVKVAGYCIGIPRIRSCGETATDACTNPVLPHRCAQMKMRSTKKIQRKWLRS